MSVATDLVAYLEGCASLVALQDKRVYPISLPQNPTLPATTYFQVSARPDQTHQAEIVFDLPRFQFDCYAATKLEVDALASALLDALLAWHAHDKSYAALYDNSQDIPEPELSRFRIQIDFLIGVS